MPAGLSDLFLPDIAGGPLAIQIFMANESPAAGPVPAVPQPTSSLTPAERSRLTQCFQHGTQSVAKNVDYAIEMFSACVVGDPANPIYLQNLLGALRLKFAGKKAGGLSALWSAGGRGGLRKLAAAGKWREVIGQGLEMIKNNPSDHGSLLVMAEASGKMGLVDAQRVYLKAALDAAPADAEVNRKCAEFLASYGEYDQAVACWMRIEKVKGMADEAQRQIAKLQVDKTISAGEGLTGRKSSAGASSGGAAAGGAAAGGAAAGTAAGGGQKTDAAAEAGGAKDRRSALLQAITKNPTVIEPYLELADLVERDGAVEEAQQVLVKALAASGNDLKVREHVEDRQLRWMRNRLHVAEKRLAEEDNPDNRHAVERLRAAQLKQEIEVYSARSTRYPENTGWKYELAMRLKAAGNHVEAIRHFQDVLLDARRKGAVSLELGECFQKIRQYPLAIRSYQTAVESLTDRELELRKRALYRAGVLAAGLDDPDAARKYLSTLAELDFGYRDVAQRLDKLTPAKDKGAGN